MLADSLDYEATLAAIAQLAVPGHGRLVRRRPRSATGGELQRVAVAHVDPEKVALAARAAERYPADPRADRGVHQVLRTGASQLWPEITDEMIVAAAHDEEHLRLIRDARDELGDGGADARARSRVRRDHVRRARSRGGASATPTCGSPRTSRCARHGGRERAPVPRPLDDRPHAAGLAAAAGAARGPRRRGRRAVPRRRRGARGRRRLLRRLRHHRRPLVRGHRRRLRQGRRGGGGHALARYTIRAAAARRSSPAAILAG